MHGLKDLLCEDSSSLQLDFEIQETPYQIPMFLFGSTKQVESEIHMEVGKAKNSLHTFKQVKQDGRTCSIRYQSQFQKSSSN
jgi:hypothetical protein